MSAHKTRRRFGALIVNADDWGRDVPDTDRALECIRAGSVSSVSAMMFMEDSERSAEIAKTDRIDTGLHLNLTAAFTASCVSPRLAEKQRQLFPYVRHHQVAHLLFNPALSKQFEYVVKSQLEEYARLYGETPRRIDGHQHMHLSANVLLARLLPAGAIVRRNFSFDAGEKGFANRLYRRVVDRLLASRHVLTDYFFALPPLHPDRLEKICKLACRAVVEVETHPVNPAEYEFLTRDGLLRFTSKMRIAKRYVVNGQMAPKWSV
jgi:chitin disaccharide deacetylase